MLDGLVSPLSSREPPDNTNAPSPSTATAWLEPAVTSTVLPAGMHATSVEPGTPLDQSAPVAQSPADGPVHVSVQDGSAAAPGVHRRGQLRNKPASTPAKIAVQAPERPLSTVANDAFPSLILQNPTLTPTLPRLARIALMSEDHYHGILRTTSCSQENSPILRHLRRTLRAARSSGSSRSPRPEKAMCTCPRAERERLSPPAVTHWRWPKGLLQRLHDAHLLPGDQGEGELQQCVVVDWLL